MTLVRDFDRCREAESPVVKPHMHLCCGAANLKPPLICTKNMQFLRFAAFGITAQAGIFAPVGSAP
jgi:hypothetical protein